MALSVFLQHMQQHYGAMAAPTETQQQQKIKQQQQAQEQEQQNIARDTVNAFASPNPAAMEAKITSEKNLEHLHTSTQQQRSNYKARLRKRDYKQISDAEYRREINSTDMPWSNPCSAQIDKSQSPPKNYRRTKRCSPYWKLIHSLRDTIREKFREVRATQEMKHKLVTLKPTAVSPRKSREIDISNMHTWSLHNYTYHFLPSLGPQSNIKLRQMHRHLQLYVGAFTYIKRAQLHYDHSHEKFDNSVAHELQDLKLNAIKALCSVELAIGQVDYISSRGALKRRSHTGKVKNASFSIKTISQSLMKSKLNKFRTSLENINVPADESNLQIDIRFLKHKYINYLRQMAKLLGKHARRICPATTTTKLTKMIAMPPPTMSSTSATLVLSAHNPKKLSTAAQPKKKLRYNNTTNINSYNNNNSNSNNQKPKRLLRQKKRTQSKSAIEKHLAQ